jgi:hypothetical protein
LTGVLAFPHSLSDGVADTTRENIKQNTDLNVKYRISSTDGLFRKMSVTGE